MDREKQTRPIDDPKQRENGSEDVAHRDLDHRERAREVEGEVGPDVLEERRAAQADQLPDVLAGPARSRGQEHALKSRTE